MKKLIALMVFLFAAAPAFAQQEPVYAPLTVKNLSQFYWAINRFSVDNDAPVDNYMLINECDIYKTYHFNDVEWKQVREAARQSIKQKVATFPTRFEIMLPIKLKDYDAASKNFEILDKYHINGIRRFEALAGDYHAEICGQKGEIPDYERGLAIELGRPFLLSEFSVEPEIAERYIKSKEEAFKKLDEDQRTQARLYETRDAYLVLRFHGETFTGPAETEDRNAKLAGVSGTLEGYDIYGDLERTMLLHSERYKAKERETSDLEQEMMQEYQQEKAQTP